MLTTDTLSSPKLRRAWLRLWHEAGEHPFQHPLWQVAALRLWHRQDPLLLALWEGESLQALAVLVRRPVDGRFQIAGTGVSGYGDFLSRPRSRLLFARELTAYVEAQQMVLDLKRMPEPFVPPTGEVVVWEDEDVFRLALTEQRMDKKLRNQLLFSQRELSRKKQLRLFTAPVTKAEDLFTILLQLRRASRKPTCVTQMLAERKRENFVFCAFRALQREGLVRVLALSLDARVVAVACVLTCGRSAFHWLSACDPRLTGAAQPALLHHLLLYHAVESFRREGFWIYDLSACGYAKAGAGGPACRVRGAGRGNAQAGLMRFDKRLAVRFGAQAKPTFRTLVFPNRLRKVLAAPLLALGHRALGGKKR